MKILFSTLFILIISFPFSYGQTSSTANQPTHNRVDVVMSNLKTNLNLTATQETQIRTIQTQTQTQVQQIIAAGKKVYAPVDIKTVYANQQASIQALLTPSQQTIFLTLNRSGEKPSAK